MRCKRLVAVAGLAHIHENTMLKRITAICMVLCLALPTFSASASAHSILWAATSDHTDLVKDEEYAATPAVLFMAPGVDEDASLLIKETDGGLEILYEEPGPPEPNSVEEAASPDLISVEEESAPELISVEDDTELPPEAELEEIELEEITNDQIQEP